MSGMGRLINGLLKPAGVEMRRVRPPEPDLRYDSTVAEVEALVRQSLFRAIPANPTRIPLLCQLLGTQIVEAMHLLNELHQCIGLEGDICEFGIAQGATSALIANEIRNTEKKLWLFDSFKGLPKPSEKDRLIDDIFSLGTMDKYHGTMACPETDVLGRMKAIDFPLDRINIVPGYIEKSSKKASLPPKVAFAYVDFDFYEPILITLRLLANRLPLEGRVMVDDYGWFSEGAQVAVDEFVKEDPRFEMVLPPAGSGHFAMLRRAR